MIRSHSSSGGEKKQLRNKYSENLFLVLSWIVPDFKAHMLFAITSAPPRANAFRTLQLVIALRSLGSQGSFVSIVFVQIWIDFA